MNKRAATIAKVQGKDSTARVKAAGAGSTSKLGEPPQDQTAQARLSNDVKGKVGKAIDQLLAK